MTGTELDLLRRIAKGLAAQFGDNCEIAIHDFSKVDEESTIVAIENGHVTGRRVGDGPSHVVLEVAGNRGRHYDDHLNYLTKTKDGRVLRSSSIFINDKHGHPSGVLSINFDITSFVIAENALKSLTVEKKEDGEEEAEYIPMNVSDLLDELIDESVRYIGKPVAMMSKDDKTRAIQFLDKKGAFLVKKSGDKVSKYFGISKYTLYNYLDLSN